MAGSLASINIKFFADLKQFSTQMQNSQRQLKKMGKQLTATGKSMSIGLTAPILAFGAVSVKTFADFEQEMAKVQAISGATGSEFTKLKDSALELGRTTRYTAAEVATLQLNYSKLGFAPEEINKVTAATLDLALATGEDLANSATVAASTLRGFGLEADEMQRVVDVMAKSFSSSALDLEKYSTAMGSLAPVAKNAGVSIEEASGFLSILVDRGVDAATAGTGLRNIFLDLAGSGQTLESAMSEIATSTNKNKVAFDLFGKRGATVAAIMADNSEEAKALAKSYEGAAGSAKKMAEIMDATLQGSMFKLKSASEGLAISFGEVLAPYVTSLANKLSGLAGYFTNLSPATKKIIVVVAGLLAVVGPLLVALGFMMTTVIPGLVTAFSFLSSVILTATGSILQFTAALLANPITVFVLAIGVMVSILVDFIQKITPAVSKLKTFFNLIKSGGNHAAFTNLQLLDQAAAMVEQQSQADASAKATEDLNKQQKAAADAAAKLTANLVKQGKVLSGNGTRKKVTGVPTTVATGNSGISQETSPIQKAFNELNGFSGKNIEGLNPLKDLPKNIKASTELASTELNSLQSTLINFSEASSEVLTNVANNFAVGFSEIIGGIMSGNATMGDVFALLLNTIGDLATQLGKSAITIGIGMLAIKMAFKNPFTAIAAGVALVALGAVIKGIASNYSGGGGGGGRRAMATGGIVYGPTNALIGEYAGATNNPEVVAPLDKLKSLIGGNGGRELVPYIAETRLSGSDLKIILTRQNKIDNRLGN